MTRPFSGSTIPYVPDPVVYPSSLRIPFGMRGRSEFVGGVDVTTEKLSVATLNFVARPGAVESARSLFLAGACPALYDGAIVHEAGFNMFPEGITLAASNTADGALTLLGVYSFVFVYEWLDANGLVHRSAPSVPVSLTLTGTDDTITASVPYMRLTDKQGPATLPGTSVRIVGYRTAANGSIYNRDVEHTSGDILVNDFTLYAPGAWVSTKADTAIAANELLFTTGGAVEPEAFPATSICCTHQRRIGMVTQEEQSFVQYTDEVDDSFVAPTTNAIYRLPIPIAGGSVVGLASMDDKWIILCQRQIYYVYGEGPNRLGQQNGYSLPQLCSAKLGAAGGCHQAITLTPDGLWFMASNGGLRLLTRGLTIASGDRQYLGAEVDGLIPDSYTTVRAATIDAKNQVRFYFDDELGTVLVWNYEQHQWSNFKNHHSPGGAISAFGKYWHASASALYSTDNATGGLDDTTAVNTVTETAWIALAGLQGFQRVYAIQLLAQAIQRCTVSIEVGYDYNPTYTEGPFSIAQSGAVDPFQLSHALLTQKCEAVRFRITTAAAGVISSVLNVLDITWKTGNAGLMFAGDDLNSPHGDGVVTALTSAASATGHVAVTGATAANFPNNDVISDVDFTWAGVVNGTPVGVLYITTTPPAVGSVLTGLNSGASATIASVINYGVGYGLVLSGLTGAFSNGEPVNYNGVAGEAVRLTSFTLSVGLKSGLNRLPAAKRF